MTVVECPICSKHINESLINSHLDSGCSKKPANSTQTTFINTKKPSVQLTDSLSLQVPKKRKINPKTIPLAERARPSDWDTFIGHTSTHKNSILRSMIENDSVPSMIIYGPPG